MFDAVPIGCFSHISSVHSWHRKANFALHNGSSLFFRLDVIYFRRRRERYLQLQTSHRLRHQKSPHQPPALPRPVPWCSCWTPTFCWRATGLRFLEKLVKNEFDDVLPHCSVLIPHIVLCELDKHKMSRKDGEVKFRARCAGRFLSDYFDGGNANGDGRIAGQTVEEHTKNARRYAGGENPDDHYPVLSRTCSIVTDIERNLR